MLSFEPSQWQWKGFIETSNSMVACPLQKLGQGRLNKEKGCPKLNINVNRCKCRHRRSNQLWRTKMQISKLSSINFFPYVASFTCVAIHASDVIASTTDKSAPLKKYQNTLNSKTTGPWKYSIVEEGTSLYLDLHDTNAVFIFLEIHLTHPARRNGTIVLLK